MALLFSVACHPSSRYGHDISADFPGVAQNLLDAALGTQAALFLQGAGGDTKPAVVARDGAWVSGQWQDVERAGAMVAEEVKQCLADGLTPVQPQIRSHAVQVPLRLGSPPDRGTLEQMASADEVPEPRRLWARRMCRCLDRGDRLSSSVPLNLHGVQLANGLRFIGLDCEPVAACGWQIDAFYRDGVTFPLGYTDGMLGYLPTSPMIEAEGGYEVVSFWEYGLPACIEPGVEAILARGLDALRARGI